MLYEAEMGKQIECTGLSKIKNSKKSKIGHSLAFFIISKDYEKFRVQDIKQKHLNVKAPLIVYHVRKFLSLPVPDNI